MCLDLEVSIVEDENERAFELPKFLVIGHRGCGMNILQSSDSRFNFVKENSILSFQAAARLPIDFIEFDVQVRLFPLCSINGGRFRK